MPKSVHFGNDTFLLSNDFKITDSSTVSSPIIASAIERYTNIIKNSNKIYYQHVYPPTKVPDVKKEFGDKHEIKSLRIFAQNPTESLEFGFDESYTLEIKQASFLKAKTQWGILRGLETFSQIFQWNGSNIIIQKCPIFITDEPRFKWRGLMIDTARHFIPVKNLETIINAMSFDKLNVFHWHLSDAEAFTLELKTQPNLANLGAYSKNAIYSQNDVKHIIKYAHDRGIRVVPEIDTPGHTFSWGNTKPSLILECANSIQRQAASSGYPGINNVPFDMTNPEVYTLLKDVMTELASLFPDSYLHLGGDEVSSKCIDEFPRVKAWMREHGMNTTSYGPLVNYYTKNLMDMIKQASPNKKMMFWAEVFNDGGGSVNPINPSNSLIHIWERHNRKATIQRAVELGFQSIVSSGWYLDVQNPNQDQSVTHYLYEDTWVDFYKDDPLFGLNTTDSRKTSLILGGEICQWGEALGPDSMTSWLWPRTSAAAERLWSRQAEVYNNNTLNRIMAHNCRHKQRGLKSVGIRPDHCEV